MKKQYWLIISLLLVPVHDSVFAQNIWLSYHTLSATDNNWQKVDISYNHDFFYKDYYDNQNITKCVKVYHTVTINRGVNTRGTATEKSIPVLRCREHISLLRPVKIINQWLLIQSKKHFFPLTIREFNIINVPAHITAVHSSVAEILPYSSCLHKAKKVTGTFERHEVDIKTYTFKNTETGKITSIHATPGHPVYVTNKASFIPMDLLSSTDELLNSSGQRIRLLCSAGHTEHCGVLMKSMVPKPVYNLEIDKNHTYFVSKIKLLVHNNCQLAEKLKEKIPDLVVTNKYRYPFLRIGSYNDINLAYSTLRTLYGNKVESDTLAILTLSHLQDKPISIMNIGSFLREKSMLPSDDYENTLRSLLGAQNKIVCKDREDEKVITMIASRQPVVAVTDKKAYVVMHPKTLGHYTRHEFINEQVQLVSSSQELEATDRFRYIFSDSLYGKPLSYYVMPTKWEMEEMNTQLREECTMTIY